MAEVLLITRSIKNAFVPINQVPPEVLATIPDYCDADKELVALTHVCSGWREHFISRSALWASLGCRNAEQTRVYLERSRASPLQLRLGEEGYAAVSNDALLLTIPHIGRLKALVLSGLSRNVLKLIEPFDSPVLHLEKLEISVSGLHLTAAGSTFFDRNLSSLRELRLSGVLTDLPWRNLTNLTTFDFRRVPGNKVPMTQLLNFFEHTPLLREIKLMNSLPDSSDAATGRVVSLPHLKLLIIHARSAHPILLDHLRIPIGALVTLGSSFRGERSPISDYSPVSLDNLRNLSHITSVNLDFNFNSGMAMRLKGPSGGLYMFGTPIDMNLVLPIVEHRILRSLDTFRISTVRRLAVTQYNGLTHSKTEESGTYQTLLPMNDLHTLTLTDCLNLSFISSLNPDRNPTNTVVCPKLEELIVYNWLRWGESYIDELLEMAKERALRGAKLSTVVIVYPRELPAESVSELRSYVSRVEYRLDGEPRRWDAIPGEVNEIDNFDDW